MRVRFLTRWAGGAPWWGLITALALTALALTASMVGAADEKPSDAKDAKNAKPDTVSAGSADDETPEGHPVAGRPLFPEGCTVILFSGLPGDIESETSYREQTQSWLEIVGHTPAVKKLFVLSDNPESLALPNTPPSKALKGDRKNLLSLGESLAAEKSPLVLIAWGHGGRQSATAVFHVRGPRLKPEDFGSFAQKADAPESNWILLFRGSGAFGRQLAGSGRQVICSDFETVFSSDPVSMPLFLKLASGSAARSFQQLTEEWGKATAGWYTERNLARTEEPTFWQGDQQPRKLAQSGTEGPAGSSEDIAVYGETRQIDAGEKTNFPAARPELTTNELSAAWNQINKVAPGKYPEADAVVLSQNLRCTLGTDPAVVTDQEQFIQILTPEGKQFGDFDVSFSPPHEEVQFLDCEVLRADGKLVRLDPERIEEARDPEPGDYQAERRKTFSLPGVAPGAVVHVRYRTQWKEFPLPRISMELPVAHELPAIKASIQVSVPKDTPFHFAFQKLAAPDPEIKGTSYSTSYSWVLENVPAHRTEILSARNQNPSLMISTFPDWKAFAEWYERISRLTDEVTPEVAAKADELTAGLTNAQEKVLALYNYVTALRYVAVPLGVNSVRPHSAANVLHNQFGDCKDKANLLNALLHSLKIEAHLVLVPRFSQAHEAVPGLAFNHAISRVRLGNDVLWIDTTDDVCRFGLLPPGDSGRRVLVIDGQSASLTQLPAADAKDHRLSLTGQIGWPENADGLPIGLKAKAVGYPDYELRTTAQDAKERRASLPLLAARFRPVAGSFALERQRATRASSLQEDFSWEAQGSAIGLAGRAGKITLLRSPFWVPREWDLAIHQRHSPLFLNQGYPLKLEQEFEFALPPGAGTISLPRPCENSQGPLRWRIEWARMPDDKLAARLSAQLDRGEFSASETPQVQEQLRALLAALGAEASVTLPQ